MLRADIDPDCKYCLACEEEYRAEIAHCADCGQELVSGAMLLQQKLDSLQAVSGEDFTGITPDEPLLTILKGPLLQIKQLHHSLKQQGIATLIAGGAAHGCSSAGCRGPELVLQARHGDLPAIMAAMERDHQRTTGLVDHDSTFAGEVYNAQVEEATCPACGCRFTTSSPACPECGLCFLCD